MEAFGSSNRLKACEKLPYPSSTLLCVWHESTIFQHCQHRRVSRPFLMVRGTGRNIAQKALKSDLLESIPHGSAIIRIGGLHGKDSHGDGIHGAYVKEVDILVFAKLILKDGFVRFVDGPP